MGSLSFFADAFRVLWREPKLFAPKLLLAVLYGLLMLESAQLALELAVISQEQLVQDASLFLMRALALFGFSLVVLVLDVWIASWFPVLVSDFKSGKKVSFSAAIRVSRPRLRVVMPLLLGFELIVSVALALLTLAAYAVFSIAGAAIALVLVLAILFVLFVLLYPLLSVSVLESGSWKDSIVRSVALSRQHWKVFSLASLVPFFISLLNIVFAFLSDMAVFWALFWLFRFVQAIVVTYANVLNPAAYWSVIEREKNGPARI